MGVVAMCSELMLLHGSNLSKMEPFSSVDKKANTRLKFQFRALVFCVKQLRLESDFTFGSFRRPRLRQKNSCDVVMKRESIVVISTNIARYWLATTIKNSLAMTLVVILLS